MTKFNTISEAIVDLRRGKMLIVVDGPERENEGDFFIPATTISPREATLMIKQGSGLLCAAITEEQRKRLKLPLMVSPQQNTEKTRVNFTISVNARRGIHTGVSSADRTRTIKVLGNPIAKPNDLVRPGHVLGLVAARGGILKRPGHTEAAVTLAKLAGFAPAGTLCEIIRPDGKMANYADLIKLAKKLRLKIIAIKDLIEYAQYINFQMHPDEIGMHKVSENERG